MLINSFLPILTSILLQSEHRVCLFSLSDPFWSMLRFRTTRNEQEMAILRQKWQKMEFKPVGGFKSLFRDVRAMLQDATVRPSIEPIGESILGVRFCRRGRQQAQFPWR